MSVSTKLKDKKKSNYSVMEKREICNGQVFMVKF